ncbi:hypothetical protein WCE41_09355 [Luteimonas sp. MJ246]|uniref:hypothetical protein n=1 Tax=Luteimonas sp. MJ174 TaxID=3129237 RepID=UPI0031BA7E21
MNHAPLLVSLHLPKTAGTSFAETLRAASGDGYRDDYADLPMQYAALRRRMQAVRGGLAMRGRVAADATCIHGHFLALKYRIALGRRPARWITWMRDPVQRLASHYAFWRRDYDGGDPAQPLRNRMLREQWTFERFALGPELRDVYRQYLWGFDPARFDFVGITEHYHADLERLARRLGWKAVAAAALVNPERGESGYDIDPRLRARIARHHAGDIALYRWALARRGAS